MTSEDLLGTINKRMEKTMANLKVIYEPKGAAREYAALACNLYRGCVHGCLYCYVPSTVQRKADEFHASVAPRKDILRSLERDAAQLADTDEPVHLCFTCDPYPPIGSCEDVTRPALEILRRFDIPVQVLTKGGMLAARDFDLLKTMRGAFGTTLIFVDEAFRREWEPWSAETRDRIRAVKLAHKQGIQTWVSIEPVIVPEQALLVIDQLAPWVDEFRIGKLNHHPAAKEVDWHRWAPLLLGAVRASGRAYLIKDSMRPYLTERQWQNERTRGVPVLTTTPAVV